jgi:hypothetical protein
MESLKAASGLRLSFVQTSSVLYLFYSSVSTRDGGYLNSVPGLSHNFPLCFTLKTRRYQGVSPSVYPCLLLFTPKTDFLERIQGLHIRQDRTQSLEESALCLLLLILCFLAQQVRSESESES